MVNLFCCIGTRGFVKLGRVFGLLVSHLDVEPVHPARCRSMNYMTWRDEQPVQL